MKIIYLILVTAMLTATSTLAAVGDLLGTVNLPGNGALSVAGTFDGKYYMTIDGYSNILQIYQPPVGGNGSAIPVANKTILDASNNSVIISAVAWDPSRGKLWGAHDDRIYLIDIGNPTISGNALAILQFNAGVGGIDLIDGLAYDGSDDTLYYSPDVDHNVYHFATNGTLLNTIAPKNANGTEDGYVSGVVVGSRNTLYIGRNGFNEIRLIDKTTGDFISDFATTFGRVEDLTCDPLTYAPKEAILSKDAYGMFYEAFEVEKGTCPLQEAIDGRMTGGGSVFAKDGMRVTHGFELHCDVADKPNNLEINWGSKKDSHRFHLENLTSAMCSDNPNIMPNPPKAGFDTYEGRGMGRYDGVSGATAKWIFTDAGEPGKKDIARISIVDAGGNVVLVVSGNLKNGNQQAHK